MELQARTLLHAAGFAAAAAVASTVALGQFSASGWLGSIAVVLTLAAAVAWLAAVASERERANRVRNFVLVGWIGLALLTLGGVNTSRVQPQSARPAPSEVQTTYTPQPGPYGPNDRLASEPEGSSR